VEREENIQDGERKKKSGSKVEREENIQDGGIGNTRMMMRDKKVK
jgi:hypothetical protein